MVSEQRTCKKCGQNFAIKTSDAAYYSKLNVPSPALCPQCRARRRLAFRNERTFYKDTCAKCKKSIVSQFAPGSGLIVYCSSCYWADDWAGQDYGVDFDFSKTFAEQFKGLGQRVPHPATLVLNSVNSEYTHLVADNKDCYMLVESSNNENCIHSYWMQICRDCLDTSYTHDSQMMYESDNCANCYKLQYSRNCEKCIESYFLLNCKNCTNCFGCVNLRNKEYCIFNNQKTKEEYGAAMKEMKLDTWSGVQKARKQSEEFALSRPRKFAEFTRAESCTGNYLNNAKNCRYCFEGYDVEDSAFGEHVWRNAKDCMDVSTAGRNAELVYEGLNCAIDDHMVRFTNGCWGSSYCDYCVYCNGLTNGFGCIDIKKGEYCILNKPYSEKEFTALKERIIGRMKETGEWGEFFDPSLSLHGYNETVAQEHYPLTKEEATKLGFKWQGNMPETTGKETVQWKDIPDSIMEVKDDITKEVLACEDCKKNFKVIKQELKFYRDFSAPIPRKCPSCRHAVRIKARGPNKLWPRACMCAGKKSEADVYENATGHFHTENHCPNEFETSYSPDRKETVYCEQCYTAEVA